MHEEKTDDESNNSLSEEVLESNSKSKIPESENLVQSNNDNDLGSKSQSSDSSEDIVIETLKEAYLDEDEDNNADDFLGKDSDLL